MNTQIIDDRLILDVPEIFEPLLLPARYKGAHGGRGSGKSHHFAEAAIDLCVAVPGTRLVAVREVQKSLKESVKLLLEDKIKNMGVGGLFNVLDAEIRTPGGGIIIFKGMQDHTAQSIKSLEGFDVAWIEEGQTISKTSLELLRPTIRKPGSEIWISWNPRNANDPVDMLLRGMAPPKNSAIVQANYSDNPFFPDVLEEEREHDEVNNADRYAHIWMGDYEPQVKGAIWTRQAIHQGRLRDIPPLERIVVGVDPAVTNTDVSDHHGIVVCGLGADGRGYVLEDGSIKGRPDQWATRVVALFDKWEADAVVIEVNQGGDMCKHTLKTVRKTLPVVEVRATRGKHVRAEPIAALYTLGKISHVGTFPEMENQMCLFTAAGYEGDDSPDRAEAMIWCMTNLFPSLTSGREPPPEDPPAGQEGGWLG